MERPPTAADPQDMLHPSRVPLLRHGFTVWRWVRGRLSRRDLTVRLLDLPVSTGTSGEPGLVLLQIDGLSRAQLDRALQEGRLPFVSELIRREGYQLHTLYSGQPATTPAVLGELFYGVPQAVPAFSFRDHRSGQVVEMIEPSIAATIQDELAKKGEGLLAGGSAYCDIYSGGAAESQFCPANVTWSALDDAAVWKKAAIYLLNIAGLMRVALLLVVEFFRALFECLISRTGRRELWHELTFIPRRMAASILVRELTGIAAEVDVTRGLPVLHVNFLGYDELAHRRGPDSAYAHRALPGIDRALRRIWNAAQASFRRDYHLWIMADHGQERTTPYDQLHGRSLTDAVNDLYTRRFAEPWRTSPERPRDDESDSEFDSQSEPPRPLVTAVGPLGYIYWPHELDDDSKEAVARQLTEDLHVPAVMFKTGDGTRLVMDGRSLPMPDAAADFVGPEHPHLAQVSEDFTQLCDHPDAGDFVVSGWKRERSAISFVAEHGAHGGPGPNETSGFVLLPPEDVHLLQTPLRPVRLRAMATALLRKERRDRAQTSGPPSRRLRLVTYNVHSCLGLDGRLSPARIARVLAALDPHVVALQELDVGRSRTGGVDQAEAIAMHLAMDLHFLPCIEATGEKYGNAVLSRLPMRLVKAALFPTSHPQFEPRGAIWVKIDVGGTELDLFTTHLGLYPPERARQLDALLGPEWLKHPACGERKIVCGDFNAGPWSRAYRRITRELRDAQQHLRCGGAPMKTWFAPFPLARIDHIFVSEGIEIRNVKVARTRLAAVASDHLPLIVDLAVEPVPSTRDAPSPAEPVNEACSGAP